MPHWQTIIVVLVVLVAAAYLAYRGWLIVSGKKAGGCGSGACGNSCGKSDEARETGLVTRPFVGIDDLVTPGKTPRATTSPGANDSMTKHQ